MSEARWTDTHTPTLVTLDPRGLAVRTVAYCRHPDSETRETRITRQTFDIAGRLIAAWDPRLWGVAPQPNLVTTYGLQGKPLLVDSVDAGWQLGLLGEAAEPLSSWDSRGSQRHTQYDELQRPCAVTEQLAGEPPQVVERLSYGDASDGLAIHNQCGQRVRHDHPAGSRRMVEYGVRGLALTEHTRFLLGLDLPDWPPDVPGREVWLEDEGFETTQQYAPSGEMLSQTDARGNLRLFAYTRAGELKESRLRLAVSMQEPKRLISEIRYNAMAQVESETAGNGVKTTADYAADDGRLRGLLSLAPDGKPLQDLSYLYDPVGNIRSVEDKSRLTRHFNNQRVEPVNHYRYDSLYQLVEATGQEVSQPSHGPALPSWQQTPLDPNQLRHYTQAFDYDAAGNLRTRHHSGAETFEMFTSASSNRSVADKEGLAEGFDANGNQQALQRGQRMSWDVRNQLREVTLVSREDGPDDTERYLYDSPGHRLRKVRLTQAASRTLRSEVRYLPGLEVHRDTATGEERHVISLEAGRSRVRVLHWVTKPPKGVLNDQLRYSLSDHLGSGTVEQDEFGGLLSREGYYAFGGTAWWVGPGATEAKYKTIRYSGKERDATGLYYYGYRYYAPWLQRWVSPDPAGMVDGTNVFMMLFNNPVNWVDAAGQNAVPAIAHFFWGGKDINPMYLSNVLTFKMRNPDYSMNVWTDRPSHILSTLSAMESGDDPAHRALARRYGQELLISKPDELFQGLAKIFPGAHKIEALFHRELNGPYRNLAAASDILRMTAMYVHGGLYMDVDVAVFSEIKALQAPEGFLAYVMGGRYVANSMIAAMPQSSFGIEFLENMMAYYKKHDEESWAKKRSHPFWRSEDTLYWTGPGLIQDSVRSLRLFLPEQLFSHRVPSERVGELIDDRRGEAGLFDRGIRSGVAAMSDWPKIRPGRRASVA
ncbi:RHS repeat-associated core domain-containing protein [Pseudomonas purpurea]|uniref:RHS repeat-associated core domain-containing protein n=1 Tax=Pseudomonas purpurea TaxID=3136737 RepID=UPI0032653EE5